MSKDTVYVLSATYHSGDGDGSMYMSERYTGQVFGETDTIATDLTDAKVFYSEGEAWDYREGAPSNGWQITPISSKRLFKDKLVG